MRITTALALALTPLFVAAENPPAGSWHFETQSGRADGVGTKRCQKFYMKKLENFSFRLDHHSSRLPGKRSPQSQSGEWGQYGPNGAAPGSYNPQPAQPPPTNSGSTNSQPPINPPAPGGNNGSPPVTPPIAQPGKGNEKPPPTKPYDVNPTGVWNPNAPPQPPKPEEQKSKCCLKLYSDDDCKALDSEMCVEDKSDEKRNTKGKAPKEFKSFNIACIPEPRVN